MPLKRRSMVSLEALLRRRLRGLMRLYKLPQGNTIRLFLLKNKEMEGIRAALIEQPGFRGREASKIKRESQINVLAFPEPTEFPHPETRVLPMGDIYVNREMARLEARRAGDDRELLTRWLIHGFLHLQGFRHYMERDRMKMEREENRLRGKIK
ncbi:MAG: rRNA maturation RNase YbeY [bacterium]|nr:rRNA maturation RNase YbeY [bacterium]